jgi:protein disulfide-isomerase A6
MTANYVMFSANKFSDEPVDYDGERTEEAFVEFLNKHCGTRRSAGGLLDETAGRHPEFDVIASRFVNAAGAARDKLFSDAELLASAFGPQYKYYLRVMEKVLNGTEDYVTKEANRYVWLFGSRCQALSVLTCRSQPTVYSQETQPCAAKA